MNTVTNASASILNANTELKVSPSNVEPAKLNRASPLAAANEQPANKQPSATEVDNALGVVNKAAIFEQRSLSFMVDEASGRSIIKVIDRSNDQLIRQIPSEELLKVAQDIQRLQEEMGQSLGFLVDRQV